VFLPLSRLAGALSLARSLGSSLCRRSRNRGRDAAFPAIVFFSVLVLPSGIEPDVSSAIAFAVQFAIQISIINANETNRGKFDWPSSL